MADFNIKEIEQLKRRIRVLGNISVACVVAIMIGLYFDTFSVLGLLLVLGGVQIARQRFKKQLKQKEYLAKMVEERTIELRVQRDQVVQESKELSDALSALAEAQDELVRNERLATVGNLTKGLLDRILNPLNYINNFAGLSVELLNDLRKNLSDESHTMTRDHYEDSMEIMEMITNNLQKITDHGATTVRIVKAMEELLKDRQGNATSADINHLCKVSLDLIKRQFEGEIAAKGIRLEFHPLALSLMIDLNIEQMSKVLYQLLSNGIYALLRKCEKQEYDPLLSMTVKRSYDKICVTIRDNGIGIEEGVKGRIFEPFFTTKPTAEASGIGLYLSREIVLNHRGSLEVVSEKDSFTEFTLLLPIYYYQERETLNNIES